MKRGSVSLSSLLLPSSMARSPQLSFWGEQFSASPSLVAQGGELLGILKSFITLMVGNFTTNHPYLDARRQCSINLSPLSIS